MLADFLISFSVPRISHEKGVIILSLIIVIFDSEV